MKEYYDDDDFRDFHQNPFAEAAVDDRSERGYRVRKRIIVVLGILLIVFAFADLYSKRVAPYFVGSERFRAIKTAQTLQSDILLILQDYGIADAWIKKRTINVADSALLRAEWTIKVPVSIPLASLYYDINGMLKKYGGKAFAIQNPKSGEHALHLKYGDIIGYSLLFLPTHSLDRKAGRIALLVDALDDASETELIAFVETKEKIAAILKPERKTLALYDRLHKAKKDILLHIHFTEEQQGHSKYDFSEDMTPLEIQSRIKFVLRNFPGVRLYFITSDKTQGAGSRFAEREFGTNKLSKMESTKLLYLDRDDAAEASTSRMTDLANLALKEGSSNGVLRLKDGSMKFLTDEIGRLRKKGFDFVSVSEFINKPGTSEQKGKL